MIKDTSAILKVRSIYVPDDNYENHKIKDMEMEIVTSHDPNKMSTSGLFINYRLVRFKRIKFKTRFQNDGEGPARTIRLETDIPDMFDKSTLEIESMYPECPICPKNEEVFIIGGGEIYNQSIEIADKIDLTRVHTTIEADTFFPEIDTDKWELVFEEFHAKDEKHDYDFTFLTYVKR